MKKYTHFFTISMLLLAVSACKKEESKPNPYGEGNGKVVFAAVKVSASFPSNPFPCKLFVNGTQIGTWTTPFTSAPTNSEACDLGTTSSSVEYVNKAGSYSFVVQSGAGNVNGTFTITENDCYMKATNF